VPAPGEYDDGEIGGIIGRGNRITQRKPAPVPLCPPQFRAFRSYKEVDGCEKEQILLTIARHHAGLCYSVVWKVNTDVLE
jgi:hypothetical protein